MVKPVQVDVVSDIMCPWCWVGKRKLEQAIQQTTDKYDVQVKWHPFLLRPNHPKEGVEKSPNTPENPRVGSHLKAAGQSVGIDFTGKCDRTPNTVMAHCLLKHALDTAGPKIQNEVQEQIFHAYFTAGDFPDVECLVRIAGQSGLDAQQTREVLESGQLEDGIMKEASAYSRAGVSGVPTFIINGIPQFSGAQDTKAFLRAFEQEANSTN